MGAGSPLATMVPRTLPVGPVYAGLFSGLTILLTRSGEPGMPEATGAAGLNTLAEGAAPVVCLSLAHAQASAPRSRPHSGAFRPNLRPTDMSA